MRHINDSDDQETVKRQLQTAYNQSTYTQAKQELMELHAELETSAPQAANSLREGLEETLTLALWNGEKASILQISWKISTDA